MDPQWLGPFEVAADLGKGFYSLRDIQTGEIVTKRVNGSHLKVYLTHSTSQSQGTLNVCTCTLVLVIKSLILVCMLL